MWTNRCSWVSFSVLHFDTYYLLIGIFRPFTFKVIINIELIATGPVAILVTSTVTSSLFLVWFVCGFSDNKCVIEQ